MNSPTVQTLEGLGWEGAGSAVAGPDVGPMWQLDPQEREGKGGLVHLREGVQQQTAVCLPIGW